MCSESSIKVFTQSKNHYLLFLLRPHLLSLLPCHLTSDLLSPSFLTHQAPGARIHRGPLPPSAVLRSHRWLPPPLGLHATAVFTGRVQPTFLLNPLPGKLFFVLFRETSFGEGGTLSPRISPVQLAPRPAKLALLHSISRGACAPTEETLLRAGSPPDVSSCYPALSCWGPGVLSY